MERVEHLAEDRGEAARRSRVEWVSALLIIVGLILVVVPIILRVVGLA